MKRNLKRYLQSKGIDSFQKLSFLLFLHRHPSLKGTIHELAERAYIGEIPLLKKIVAELQGVGLIERTEDRYKLRDEPPIKSYLSGLARLFEDPLARQELLQVLPRHQPVLGMA